MTVRYRLNEARLPALVTKRAAAALLAGLLVFAHAASAVAQNSMQTSLETLRSDLFSISLLTVRSEQAFPDWTLQSTVSRSDYQLDFQPATFDLLGKPVRIDEQAYFASLNATRSLADKLSLDVGIGHRAGFPNYRALWLDTYFDQHFAPLEGVPGHELYREVEPSATSASAGLNWEYLPANATASVSVSRIQDNVSPGYEIDFDGIRRGELVLATTSLSLVTENVLNPRLRSRFAITATETSSRDTRYAAELALNAAIGERWVWRNTLGASSENPQFDAHFFESTLELQVNEPLAVYLQGRRYTDTGEIENALLFTTAAPGLENESLGLGLRYLGASWSARLAATHSRAAFAETNVNVDFFRNLYLDSDWTTLQLAIGKRF